MKKSRGKKSEEKLESSENESSDSDYDVEDNVGPITSSTKNSKKNGFEVVSQDPGIFINILF